MIRESGSIHPEATLVSPVSKPVGRIRSPSSGNLSCSTSKCEYPLPLLQLTTEPLLDASTSCVRFMVQQYRHMQIDTGTRFTPSTQRNLTLSTCVCLFSTVNRRNVQTWATHTVCRVFFVSFECFMRCCCRSNRLTFCAFGIY